MNYRFIGFHELTESHTGIYIYNTFINILNEYFNLKFNNILSIIRDNASNNDIFIKTIKKQKKTFYDIRCTAHIINLVVQTILRDYILNTKSKKNIIEYINEFINNEDNDIYIFDNNLDNIIIKLRKLINLIKYIQENRKLLFEGIEKYKREGVISSDYNVIHIPLDNTTRWNSTFNMIKTAIDLKQPIIYISKNITNKEFKRYILIDNEWSVLNELKNIFEIFVKPSVKLQRQLYITLNKSLLYIYQIYNKLEHLIDIFKKKPQSISNFYNVLISTINAGIEKLNKYFPRKLTPSLLKHYKLYIINIILDLRLKLLHFEESGLLYFYSNISNDITNLLKTEFTKLKIELKRKSTASNISFDKLNENEIYNKSNSDSDSDSDDIYIRNEISDEEYTIYLNENTAPKKIDLL